jgi:hypothetical protein
MVTAQRRRYPHLPEGHPPGFQSRSRYGAVGWFILLLPLLLGMFFVGGGLVLLVGAPSSEYTSSMLIGAAVLGIPGIAIVAIGIWLLRRRNPKPASHLHLDVDPVEIGRGESVTATLTITDLGKVGNDEVRVGLVCTEWYEATRMDYDPTTTRIIRSVTASATAHEQWMPVERKPEPQPVTFAIPPDAPFSYEGSCLSFGWRVTVRQVVPRRTDPVADVPIWVSP